MQKQQLTEEQTMQAFENCRKPCCNGCPLTSDVECTTTLLRAAEQLIIEKNKFFSEVEEKLKKVFVEVQEAKELHEKDITKAAAKAVTDFSNALKQLDTGYDEEDGLYMIESEKWDKLLAEKVGKCK